MFQFNPTFFQGYFQFIRISLIRKKEYILKISKHSISNLIKTNFMIIDSIFEKHKFVIYYYYQYRFKLQKLAKLKQMEGEQKQKSQSSELKQKIFDYTAQLVSNEMNMNLYIALIVIQNIQFIAYYNNGLTTYNSIGFSQFASVVQYINLVTFLQNYNINLYLVPFFFGLNIIHIILLIAGYRSYRNRVQKISKTVQRNFHKNKIEYFINLFMIFYTTILTIPMFQTGLTAFYCSTTGNPFTMIQDCYNGTELIIAILGFLNLVWLLFITFFYSMYYCNHSPFSSSFVTCSSNWYNLGKFVVKVGPMVYYMYDPTVSFTILYLIIMNALYSTYLIVFSKFLFGYYRYNFRLQKLMIGIETFTCTYSFGFILVTLFQDVNGNPNMILVAWIFLSFFISLIVVELTIIMKKGIITEINQVQNYKLADIMEYLIYLIYEVQASFHQNKGVFHVMNIAKDHQKKCQDPKCYCVTFFQSAKNPSYNKQKQTFYLLLLAIIDRIIKQNKKAYSFFILKAYILYYKMESEIKAATTISILISDKLQFSDEMLAKGLLFQLNNQYNDTRDMQIYRRFNDGLLKQEEQSLTLVNLYLSYWEELIDQKSSIPKLQNILKKLKLSKTKLEKIVDSSLQIFNHNTRVLQIYKILVKEVLNDYLGYMRCEQMFKIGLKQSKLSVVDTVNKIQFRPNQNLMVINFTKNYSTHTQLIGSYKVVSISSNVKQFLGFTCNELKNHSINQLIPRIYHKAHDQYVDSILNKKNSEIQSKQIRIFPMTSQGYIIQCNLISKFMPCIVNGIIIVSFMEQCQRQNDELFLMYDAKTGAVDSMSKEAELILKDGAHKKMTDVFTMADFIGDILPTWDFKNQVARDLSKRNKSTKSIKSLSQIKYQIKNIEIVRSDGREEKNIKVIKVKILQFCRLTTMPQYINDKQVNTNPAINVNQGQRQNSKESFVKLDTFQIEQMIQIQSRRLNSRDKQRKKTVKVLQQNVRNKVWFIESLPPKYLRVIFSVIQSIMFLIVFGLIVFQFYNSNQNLTRYNEDISLLISLNSIQSYESDMTFITSLVATNEAYTNSNMTLPYQSYVSQIEIADEMGQMMEKLEIMTTYLDSIMPLMISKVNNVEITEQQLMVQAKFLKIAGTKQYFTKRITVFQAIYQFVSYGRQLLSDLQSNTKSIQNMISAPYYFYIFANSLNVIPDKMINIKNLLISSISSSTNTSFNIFLGIKMLIAGLIVISALIIIFFHRYIYNSYILKVLMIYQKINLDQIRHYRQKCNKFKSSLKFTNDKEKEIKSADQIESSPSGNENLIIQVKVSSNNIEEQDESKTLLKVKDITLKDPDEIQLQHFINFQQKPTLKKVMIQKILWIILYGILLTILCYSYNSQTIVLGHGIVTLNNYTQAQNAIIQIRLYTHLSMNMLNYWDSSYLQIINTELENKLKLSLEFMNNTGLDFTAFKPYFSAKYHEIKRIQQYLAKNNTQKLIEQTKIIEATLQDMDTLLTYLLSQCLNYFTVVQNYSSVMSSYINVYIILNLLFVMSYWIFGVKKSYDKLLEEFSITFQMYNILGESLRSEVQANN